MLNQVHHLPRLQLMHLVLNHGSLASHGSLNDADGYVVVRSTSAITDEPIDGVIYDAGAPLGQAKVMYVGNASGCVIREVVADEYFLKIYPYKDQNAHQIITWIPYTSVV